MNYVFRRDYAKKGVTKKADVTPKTKKAKAEKPKAEKPETPEETNTKADEA